MAYNLKLDIYYFSLKKITQTLEKNTKDGKRMGYRTEKMPCLFQEFVNSLSLKEDDKYMEVLLSNFINNFNESFKTNMNNTQAVSITTDLYHRYRASKYTACGVFKGGTTGISREIYNFDNAADVKGTINNDNVTSLLYFYKLWLPRDSNVGILMVQSYTSIGCTALFKKQLENYFISKEYKPDWYKCIPKSYIEKYLKNGELNEIQVLHSVKDDSKPLEPIFGPFVKASKKSVFSKFSISLGKLLSIVDYKKVLASQIKAIDTNYDESKDQVKLFFSYNGRNANSSLADIEKILPNITLEDSLKDEKTQLPIWKDLDEFTDVLLEELKSQINYTPTVIEK